MDKHVFLCETESEYEKLDYEIPHVALTQDDNIVHYDPLDDELPSSTYELFDILWSDGRATQEVRPVSEGVFPVGICVVPTDWFAPGEKARFVSLKYMSSTDPANGSLNREKLYWGAYNTSPDPVTSSYRPYLCKDASDEKLGDSTTYGYCYSFLYPRGIPIIGAPWYKEQWDMIYSYCSQNPGKYAVGDFDGKKNTAAISVDGNYYSTAAKDMKTCVAAYKTEGTQAGEWYIPSAAEMIYAMIRLTEDMIPTPVYTGVTLNDILAKLQKLYPNHCVSKFVSDEYYWTSSVTNAAKAVCCVKYDYCAGIESQNRNTGSYVLAFLQR